ncbi:CoA transferase, partial [Acinetobacter baumannii]
MPHTLQLPLHGVRVVEFEGIGPGPLAARMLVDMGAEVIALARAEQAAGAQRLGGAVENPLHRGKKVEVIDLK